MSACPECSAPQGPTGSCREQWDALLALEFSEPSTFHVHFLTVACYQLQHPRTQPLSEDARRQLARALEDVVVHGRAITDVQREMGATFAGATRVRPNEMDGDQASLTSVDRWTTTVADVGPPDPDLHATRVLEWARAIHDDLQR